MKIDENHIIEMAAEKLPKRPNEIFEENTNDDAQTIVRSCRHGDGESWKALTSF